MKLKVGKKRHPVTFTDVLYVPGLGTNLISCGELGRVGIRSVFTDKDCLLEDRRSKNAVIGKGRRHVAGLYVLDAKITPCAPPRAAKASASTLKIWHRRLAHAGDKVIRGALKNQEEHYGTVSSEDTVGCEVCPEAKAQKKPFKGTLTHRGTKVRSVIHSDLAGPFRIKTTRGERYLASFIDGASRSATAVLLSKKSDLYEAFDEFRIEFERANDCKIKAVHSDDGGEYEGLYQKKLKPLGIISTRTQRYSPSANGIAEVWNKNTIGRSRAMLLEAESRGGKLPQEVWGYGARYANVQHELLPTLTPDGVFLSPYERRTGVPPDIKYFKVFGCAAWWHVPKEIRPPEKKLARRGKKGIFLGIERFNNYLILDLASGKVVVPNGPAA